MDYWNNVAQDINANLTEDDQLIFTIESSTQSYADDFDAFMWILPETTTVSSGGNSYTFNILNNNDGTFTLEPRGFDIEDLDSDDVLNINFDFKVCYNYTNERGVTTVMENDATASISISGMDTPAPEVQIETSNKPPIANNVEVTDFEDGSVDFDGSGPDGTSTIKVQMDANDPDAPDSELDWELNGVNVSGTQSVLSPSNVVGDLEQVLRDSFNTETGLVDLDPSLFTFLDEGEEIVFSFGYIVHDKDGGHACADAKITIKGLANNEKPEVKQVLFVEDEDDKDNSGAIASDNSISDQDHSSDTEGTLEFDLLGSNNAQGHPAVTDADGDNIFITYIELNQSSDGNGYSVQTTGNGKFKLDPAEFQHLAEGEVIELEIRYKAKDAESDHQDGLAIVKIIGTDDPIILNTFCYVDCEDGTGDADDNGPDTTSSMQYNFNEGDADLEYIVQDVKVMTDEFGGGQDITADYPGFEVLNNDDGTFSIVNYEEAFDHMNNGDSIFVTITYVAADNGNFSEPTVGHVEILGKNDCPVACDDFTSVTEGGTTLNVNVLSNDTDVDSNDNPSNFSLDDIDYIRLVDENGNELLDPVTNPNVISQYVTSDVNGNVTFDSSIFADQGIDIPEDVVYQALVGYTMSDDEDCPSSAILIVDVKGEYENEPPLINGCNHYEDEDAIDGTIVLGDGSSTDDSVGAQGEFTFDFNVTDVDSTDLDFVVHSIQPIVINGQDVLAEIQVNNDGTFTITNPEIFDALEVGENKVIHFKYDVDDNDGNVFTGEDGSVTIYGTTPNADDDIAQGNSATNIVIDVLDNDEDIDGNFLFYDVGNGTPVSEIYIGNAAAPITGADVNNYISVNGNNDIVFNSDHSVFNDLDLGESVQVSFTYYVEDEAGSEDTTSAKVTLTVNGTNIPNTPPEVVDVEITDFEDGSIDVDGAEGPDTTSTIQLQLVGTDADVSPSVINNELTYDIDYDTITLELPDGFVIPMVPNQVYQDLLFQSFDPNTGVVVVNHPIFDELNEGQEAVITFKYTATDSEGAESTPGSAKITIKGIDDNNPPTAEFVCWIDNEDGTLDADGPATGPDTDEFGMMTYSLNFTTEDDLSNLSFEFKNIKVFDHLGNELDLDVDFINNGDGTITLNYEDYQFLNIGEFVDVQFEYKVTDSYGESDFADGCVKVLGLEDACPIDAVDDSAMVDEGASVIIDILDNDIEVPDGYVLAMDDIDFVTVDGTTYTDPADIANFVSINGDGDVVFDAPDLNLGPNDIAQAQIGYTISEDSSTTYTYEKSGNGGGGTANYENVEMNYTPDAQNFSFELENSGGEIDGFWMVVSDGDNPKGDVNEYAIMYADLDNNVITTYVYNGANSADSWNNPGEYITSFNGVISNVTNGAGNQVISFEIDASEINAHVPITPAVAGNDWDGVAFDDMAGLWLHTSQGSDFEYDSNGQITDYEFYKQNYQDSNNVETTSEEGHGCEDSAVVNIKINGDNRPPIAEDDFFVAQEDSGDLQIDLFADNDDSSDLVDRDPDGDDIDLVSIDYVTIGGQTFTGTDIATYVSVVSNENGQITFDTDTIELAKDETETVLIGYTIEDQHGATGPDSSAVVTITLKGTDDKPKAVDVSFVEDEDGVDTTPDAEVTINPLGGAPETYTDQDDSLTDGDATGILTFKLEGTDVDTPVDQLTFNITTPISGIDEDGVPVALAPSDYEIVGDELRVDSTIFDSLQQGEGLKLNFKYTVSDATSTSDEANGQVVIIGTNNPPIAEDDFAGTIEEGETDTVNVFENNGSGLDRDPDGDDISIINNAMQGIKDIVFLDSIGTDALLPIDVNQAISSGLISLDANGDMVMNSAVLQSEFGIDIADGRTAQLQVRYEITDGQFNDDAVVTFNIKAEEIENNPPEAECLIYFEDEDGNPNYDGPGGVFDDTLVDNALVFGFGGTDADGDPLTYRFVNEQTDPVTGDKFIMTTNLNNGQQVKVINNENGTFSLDVADFDYLLQDQLATLQVSFIANDGTEDSVNIGHGVVTITGLNQGINPVDEEFTINEGDVEDFDVLGNDTNPDNTGDPTLISGDEIEEIRIDGDVFAPNDPTIQDLFEVNPDGTINIDSNELIGLGYDATPQTPVVIEVDYNITDPDGDEGTATLTVNVIDTNNPPDAEDDPEDPDGPDNQIGTDDDQATIKEGEDITIDVLENDSDPDGDPLTITGIFDINVPGRPDITDANIADYVEIVTVGGEQQIKFISNDIDVDPDNPIQATFKYSISDGRGGTDTATVTVTIIDDNTPPETREVTFIDDEDDKDNSGAIANDNSISDQDHSTDPEGTLVFDLQGTDNVEGQTAVIDVDGDPLTFSDFVITNASTGETYSITGNANGTFKLDTAEFQTLAKGAVATLTIAYMVSDGVNPAVAGTAKVNIIGTNDGPIPEDDGDDPNTVGAENDEIAMQEGADADIPVLDNDVDLDGPDPLTVVPTGFGDLVIDGVSIPDSEIPNYITLNGDGTVNFDSSGSGVSSPIDAPEGGHIDVSFTYTVTDGIDQASATVFVKVTDGNDKPKVTDIRYVEDEDGVDTTPDAEAVVEGDTFTDTDDATTETVAGDVFINFQFQGTDDNTPSDQLDYSIVPGTLQAVDNDGNPVNLADYPHEIIDDMIRFNTDDFQHLGTGKAIKFTFEYTAEDGSGLVSDPADAQIVVIGTNDAPIAEDDIVGLVDEGDEFTVSVLDNDSDPDGDVITINPTDPITKVEIGGVVIDVTDAISSGLVTVNANGTVTIDTAKLEDFGIDIPEGQTVDGCITYQITDGELGDDADILFTLEGKKDQDEEICINATTGSIILETNNLDATSEYIDSSEITLGVVEDYADDTYTSGSGNDLISGDVCDFTFRATAGDASALAMPSNNGQNASATTDASVVLNDVNFGSDVISSGAGNDMVYGDTITLNFIGQQGTMSAAYTEDCVLPESTASANVVVKDNLVNFGNDTLDGGIGNDTIVGDVDVITFSYTNFTAVNDNDPATTIVDEDMWSGGNEMVFGDDTITGGMGDDTLVGDVRQVEIDGEVFNFAEADAVTNLVSHDPNGYGYSANIFTFGADTFVFDVSQNFGADKIVDFGNGADTMQFNNVGDQNNDGSVTLDDLLQITTLANDSGSLQLIVQAPNGDGGTITLMNVEFDPLNNTLTDYGLDDDISVI